MLRHILLIALYFHTWNIHAQSKHKEPSSLICWQENIKLRQRDFQAKVNPYSQDSTVTANAAPELSVNGFIDEQGKNNYLVQCAFNKTRAWFGDTTSVMVFVILAHEQIHFDIAELIARKLRMKISQSYKAGKDVFAPEIQADIEHLLGVSDGMQDLYDRETNHGLIVSQQKRWGALIASELNKFRAYKSTALTCQ
jgi:hypothetical protein